MTRRTPKTKAMKIYFTHQEALRILEAVHGARSMHTEFLMHDDWDEPGGMDPGRAREVRAQNKEYRKLTTLISKKLERKA